jgi:transcription initiation factor TFIIB
MTSNSSSKESFLDWDDNQIDNLLYGVSLEKKEEKKEKECISCKGTNLVFNAKNSSFDCQDCGVINEEVLDRNPEFSNQEGSARYGCPTSAFYPVSALGTTMKTKGYSRIAMLQKQDHMPYKEKAKMNVLTGIQKKCEQYGITQPVMDSAKCLYNTINNKKHEKGRRKGKNHIMRCLNRRSMIAACVFFACKIQGELRSPKEIADIYDLELKNVNRGCKKFQEFIDVNKLIKEFNSSESYDFIERFSKKLNMSEEDIKYAKDISINIHKLNLASTHEPPSVAAGCIMLVVNQKNLNITKKNISEIFKISDVTIAKTYRRIYPFHLMICNNEITDLIVKKKKSLPKKKIQIPIEDFIKV